MHSGQTVFLFVCDSNPFSTVFRLTPAPSLQQVVSASASTFSNKVLVRSSPNSSCSTGFTSNITNCPSGLTCSITTGSSSSECLIYYNQQTTSSDDSDESLWWLMLLLLIPFLCCCLAALAMMKKKKGNKVCARGAHAAGRWPCLDSPSPHPCLQWSGPHPHGRLRRDDIRRRRNLPFPPGPRFCSGKRGGKFIGASFGTQPCGFRTPPPSSHTPRGGSNSDDIAMVRVGRGGC